MDKQQIVKTVVEPLKGKPGMALLTVTYADGLEASATIGQPAATELVQNLQAFTCRNIR